MTFSLIHGRHLPGHGSQVVFRPCAASVNNHDIGKPHLWVVTRDFPNHGTHLSGRGSQVVFRPRPTWTTMRSDSPIYHGRHQAVSKVVSRPRPMWTSMRSGNPIYHGRYLPAVSKVVSRPRPMWTSMRSGNPNYELLYEFTLHCHLLGNLSVRSPFWQEWFQIYFKIEETTKNLNQVGRPRDLNPGPPECESRALPRSHLARWERFCWHEWYPEIWNLQGCIFSMTIIYTRKSALPNVHHSFRFSLVFLNTNV